MGSGSCENVTKRFANPLRIHTCLSAPPAREASLLLLLLLLLFPKPLADDDPLPLLLLAETPTAAALARRLGARSIVGGLQPPGVAPREQARLIIVSASLKFTGRVPEARAC